MRIICAHYQTIYELQAVDADTTLICHRCHTEFNIGQTSDTAAQDDAGKADERTENLFEAATQTPIIPARDMADIADDNPDCSPAAEDSGPNAKATDLESDDSESNELLAENTRDAVQTSAVAPPPQRRKAHIMPWLFSILLIIAGSGFWVNQDAWLDDPWLRSVLLNIGLDIQVRDKDWFIDPQSVEVTWLKRKQNDTVLVVNGEVHNLLQTDLPPPAIHFTLFSRDNPDTRILERDMIITRPPLMQTIRKTPYTPPPKDTTLIPALGSRGFILVLENMPQNAGNFTLSPVVR